MLRETMRSAIFILCVGFFLAGAHGAPTVEDLLARAESAVAAAGDVADATQQTALYDEAIASYRAVIEAGIENASLHRNIGTVYILQGDIGRAIASLRRADRLDPIDPRVSDSLDAARAMVRSEVSVGTRTRASDVAFFWRGLVSRKVLAWIGAVAWAAVWFSLAWWILCRSRGQASGRGLGIAAVGGMVCLVTFGSLAAERALLIMNPSGVVIDDGVVGYRGPSGSVYEPTFEEAIRAGVEGAIVEERDGWVRLRLRSGAETWVPQASIEIV